MERDKISSISSGRARVNTLSGCRYIASSAGSPHRSSVKTQRSAGIPTTRYGETPAYLDLDVDDVIC